MSPSDSLETAQAKMQEYINNQVQMGWLLNRRSQQVEIYRPGQQIEVLQTPDRLDGELILPGFVLELQWFWQA